MKWLLLCRQFHRGLATASLASLEPQRPFCLSSVRILSFHSGTEWTSGCHRSEGLFAAIEAWPAPRSPNHPTLVLYSSLTHSSHRTHSTDFNSGPFFVGHMGPTPPQVCTHRLCSCNELKCVWCFSLCRSHTLFLGYSVYAHVCRCVHAASHHHTATVI